MGGGAVGSAVGGMGELMSVGIWSGISAARIGVPRRFVSGDGEHATRKTMICIMVMIGLILMAT